MMLNEQTKKQKEHRLLVMAVFFCFITLYAVTAQRGVSWQDSGEFQYRILAGDYLWNSGIARAHPLYILMAKGFAAVFPKAACFYAANVFSGLGLALALALLANNVMRLTRSVWAAVTAVSVLGLAHMAWWLGTIAEVYTWSLAFLMAEILCLIRYAETRDSRWLIVLFGVNGAHFGIHNAALLGLPVYAFLLASEVGRRKERCWAALCGCVVFWLIGGSSVVWQAARLLGETGNPLAVLKNVLFGVGYERQVLGLAGFQIKVWAANMALAGVSLTNPCWLFAGRGIVLREREGQRGILNWLRALTVLHGVFWVRYFVPDQATFLLPTLGLFALWVGLGSASLCLNRRLYATWLTVGIVCAVAVPGFLCDIGERAGLSVQRKRSLPFRDEMRYWVLPWKQHEDSAARFVGEIGKQLRAGDVLLADATAAGPLLAAREAGVISRQWRLITPWSMSPEAEARELIRDTSARVFVVSPVRGYMPQAVLDAAVGFEKVGVVYRVKGKKREISE